MSDYTAARARLDDALNHVPPDGPEWIKINAAIAALDDAEVARIRQEFRQVSQRIDDAAAKLRSLVEGLAPNAASALLERLNAALAALQPLAANAAALLSGEPATAIAGTVLDNKPAAPAADAPSVPPVREYARDLADPLAR